MRYQRIEPVDVLERTEGTLVLYERQLVSLSPLGAELFLTCVEPRTLAELTAHLIAALGDPGSEAAAATSTAVAQLIDQGVLRELP